MSIALTAIQFWAAFFHIDAPVMAAICHHESGGNSQIDISPRDTESVGMCQVRPETAYSFGFKGSIAELKKPWINAKYSAKWLALCYRRFTKSEERIACYNSGRAHTRTKNYVERVSKFIPRYAATLSNTRPQPN